MAHAACVGQNVIATLVRESELRSSDIANHDHDRIGHCLAGVVRDGSRNGESSRRLRRRALLSADGNEKQRDEQA